MSKKIVKVFWRASVFLWVGIFSVTVGAAEGSTSGRVISIAVSGSDGIDLTAPYTGQTGVAFALVDIELEGGMPSTLVLDSESERAMLVGLISSLATGQEVILTGEVLSTCVGDQIEPITKVTFN